MLAVLLLTVGCAAQSNSDARSRALHIDKVSIVCLARNIYHEARGEVYEGQVGVAHVTMNRVRDSRWPNTVCGVVYQRKQFSWTLEEPLYETDEKAWTLALNIAEQVVYGIERDPTYGANHYHASWMTPWWVNPSKRTIRIHHHIFYKE
jgi:spore germination cell wall hydrolase CwlJ-like protein